MITPSVAASLRREPRPARWSVVGPMWLSTSREKKRLIDFAVASCGEGRPGSASRSGDVTFAVPKCPEPNQFQAPCLVAYSWYAP